MINWGNGVILPGQIWIFVDLQNIPEESFHDPRVFMQLSSLQIQIPTYRKGNYPRSCNHS